MFSPTGSLLPNPLALSPGSVGIPEPLAPREVLSTYLKLRPACSMFGSIFPLLSFSPAFLGVRRLSLAPGAYRWNYQVRNVGPPPPAALSQKTGGNYSILCGQVEPTGRPPHLTPAERELGQAGVRPWGWVGSGSHTHPCAPHHSKDSHGI